MLLDNLQKALIQTAKEGANVTYCIWGKHGIGKSQTVEQVAHILKWGFRNIRLSQIDPAELIGMPEKKTTTITHLDGSTEVIDYLEYSPPRWYVDAMRGNYVIFLDELNRAKKDVIQAAFELVNERQLNGRKLPNNVLIVTACNPPSPKYDTIEFDEALVDRFCHVLVHSNYDVWLNWAKVKVKSNSGKDKQKISSDIVSFLSLDKSRQTFDSTDEEDSIFPVTCKPSPRSWEKVDAVYNLNIDQGIKQELISGIVGNEICINFFQSIGKGNKPISLDELFAMDINDKEDPTMEKIKQYAKTNFDAEAMDKNGEMIVETALLSQTSDDLVRDDNKEIVQKHADQVLTYLTLIPPDVSQKTLKRLCNNRAYKKFWEVKLSEEVGGKPRWEQLILNLSKLAEARENINIKS